MWDVATGQLEKQLPGLDLKPDPFVMKRWRRFEIDPTAKCIRYGRTVIDLGTGATKTIPETWQGQPVVWQFLRSDQQALVIGGGNGKDQAVFVQTVKIGK